MFVKNGHTSRISIAMVLPARITCLIAEPGWESQNNGQTKSWQIIEINWIMPRAKFSDLALVFQCKGIEVNGIRMINKNCI
jgi:hypothetical protein